MESSHQNQRKLSKETSSRAQASSTTTNEVAVQQTKIKTGSRAASLSPLNILQSAAKSMIKSAYHRNNRANRHGKRTESENELAHEANRNREEDENDEEEDDGDEEEGDQVGEDEEEPTAKIDPYYEEENKNETWRDLSAAAKPKQYFLSSYPSDDPNESLVGKNKCSRKKSDEEKQSSSSRNQRRSSNQEEKK